MTPAAWSRLLAMMREGSVVPVVGSRLLVDADGKGSLQAQVAAQLLHNYDVEMPEGGLPRFREVNEAVSLLKGKADLQELYSDIYIAMDALRRDGVVVPRPLQQLAAISDFRLLVTLTPDDLLAQALRQARRPVNEIVHTLKPSADQLTDLPRDWSQQGNTAQLLYLFGKARSTPQYSIHDEDMLEYAHNVIAGGDNKPKNFLAELHDRNLLLVGCNFPDWLSRFMLRATRKDRLVDTQGRRGWLVEPLASEDPVISFLGRYSPATSVLSNVDPTQFVDELHRRWLEAQTPGAANGVAVPAAAELPRPEKAMFFISYSRTTDQTSAFKVYEMLRRLGVAEAEIWFDRETLEPGKDYQRAILDGIRGCRYFLPVLSRAATQREEAFAFIEWDVATQRLPAMNRTFLVPLVVDDEHRPEAYAQASVAAWRDRHIDFGHAPGGEADTRVLDTLKQLVRAARPAI